MYESGTLVIYIKHMQCSDVRSIVGVYTYN